MGNETLTFFYKLFLLDFINNSFIFWHMDKSPQISFLFLFDSLVWFLCLMAYQPSSFI